MEKHLSKNGDKSCQSNFDKKLSGFGSFLISYLITTVTTPDSKYLCGSWIPPSLEWQTTHAQLHPAAPM